MSMDIDLSVKNNFEGREGDTVSQGEREGWWDVWCHVSGLTIWEESIQLSPNFISETKENSWWIKSKVKC